MGRIGATEFDYSASWVRQSVARSLERLGTDYLDVVYCHDVEFVSAEEVLTAVKELRRLRDGDGALKYIGISGYPVEVLADRAQMVLDATGEPLDIIMSYANFTLQNTQLKTVGLPRLIAAGVDVVPNASVLGMGLLRRKGVPIGAQGDFHPSPKGLREVIGQASRQCEEKDDRIEKVAIRFAIESWMREGQAVGSRGDPAAEVLRDGDIAEHSNRRKLGVSVIGVSNIEELDETIRVWRSVLDGLEESESSAGMSEQKTKDRQWSLQRRQEVKQRATEVRQILGDWYDYTWPSPPPNFISSRQIKAVGDPQQLPTPVSSPDIVVNRKRY